MAPSTQNIFHKGGKRVDFSSSVLIEPTCSQNHSSQPKALPRIPLEEMNLLSHVVDATFSCQLN